MNLDEMLSQPLPDVPDNGFSERVVARVKREERYKAIAVVLVAVVATTLVCLLVPMRDYTGTIGAFLVQFALSPLASIAVSALALTFLIDRLWSDRQLLQF